VLGAWLCCEETSFPDYLLGVVHRLVYASTHLGMSEDLGDGVDGEKTDEHPRSPVSDLNEFLSLIGCAFGKVHEHVPIPIRSLLLDD